MGGHIPALEALPSYNEDGVGGMHIYMPWWLDNRKLDFPRGYHIELCGGRDMPATASWAASTGCTGGGYGKKLKDDYRRLYGSMIWLSGRGEMIPNEDSYCEIDPRVVDRWGIPVLRFHWKWSEHELNQARHMQRDLRGDHRDDGRQGDRRHAGRDADHGLKVGGEIIHEAGCTRMGDEPAHLGPERVVPGPRREEPVRGRQRAVRHATRTRT